MALTALHLEIGNALYPTDELARHEHALGNDAFAAILASFRTELAELERVAGKSHRVRVAPRPTLLETIERATHMLRLHRDEVPRSLRSRFARLVATAERVV